MDAELREMLDHHQIRQVILRYCRGIDRADPEVLGTVYHEGAAPKHWSGEFGDATDFVEFAVKRVESFGMPTQHHITNCLIAVDGDRASAETYFLALQPTKVEGGGEVLSFIGGRYLDRFERRDGRWGIVDRLSVNDWSRLSLPGDPWPHQEGYASGGLREADPSHELFARSPGTAAETR
jgi:hypothetical protein